jgi:rod shape-determining protein MreC
VLPLTDAASGIGAVTTRGHALGVLKGHRGGKCRVLYLSSQADIKPGDAVVTSGLGSIFPRGLLLGTVESVASDPAIAARTAVVKPAANPAAAQIVVLVK